MFFIREIFCCKSTKISKYIEAIALHIFDPIWTIDTDSVEMIDRSNENQLIQEYENNKS